MQHEIPYGTAVKLQRYAEDDGPLVNIFSEIMVAKENHRAIVIGREGATLKQIGTEARKEMEKLTGRRIYLDLKVQSKKGWQKNPGMMKDLGYVLHKA